MNPFFVTDFSISDSLKTVRKSVLIYETIIIKPITRTDGLPDTWDRYGYMGGSNFADVPSTGKYTYSERAIPYVENEAAYHTGTFNDVTYFDKIDAIKNGDIDTFNELLHNEGISKWDLDDFEELCDSYNAQLKHIFREGNGHIIDIPDNRSKILNVANDKKNYLGRDARGNDWYAKTESDGSQIWVRTRNGKVDNAGVNTTPRTWDDETGLYNNTR